MLSLGVVTGAKWRPISGRRTQSALDDLVREQRRDEGDTDQTAKKNHIGHAFNPDAQPGSIRIADRQIRAQSAGKEGDGGHSRVLIDMRRSVLCFSKLHQPDQRRADANHRPRDRENVGGEALASCSYRDAVGHALLANLGSPEWRAPLTAGPMIQAAVENKYSFNMQVSAAAIAVPIEIIRTRPHLRHDDF
jgi:hypothetical protein